MLHREMTLGLWLLFSLSNNLAITNANYFGCANPDINTNNHSHKLYPNMFCAIYCNKFLFNLCDHNM